MTMNATVLAEFRAPTEAQRAVDALLSAGLLKDHISLVMPDGRPTDAHVPSLAVRDAEKGALVGSLAGLMLGLTELSVPGVGPILAGGWLVTALIGAVVGAAGGGVAGALIEHGLSANVAHALAEAIGNGKAVLIVSVERDRAESVGDLLRRQGPDHVHIYACEAPPEAYAPR